MSQIFSLLKESGIPSEMFSSTFSNERYLETSLNLLESVNADVANETKTLYDKISEAKDVKEENDAIKSFISYIQMKLDKLALDLNAISSRFSIAISNYCDNARQQIEDNNLNGNIGNFSYTDEYTSFKREALISSEVPKLNPYRVFEREFNFIASLMQDLPITASNKDKLNVVATVCSKFNTTMRNQNATKVYEDLFGVNSEDTNISSYIVSLFQGEKSEKTIGTEEYNDAVSCITGCDELIDGISTMITRLQDDLVHIISDLNDILAGADRNKFKVDTKEDGIKNTIYSVDIYTSNKIMWLVQDKIQQITDDYNKYILAVTLKIDCIMRYVRQSCDIINSFTYIKSSSASEEDQSEPEINNDDVGDDIEDPAADTNDVIGKEVTEDDNDDIEVEDTGEDASSDDDFLEPESTDDTVQELEKEIDDTADAVPDFESNEDSELEEAVREFYVSIYEYSYASTRLSVLEHAVSLLNEEDQPAGSGDGGTEKSDDNSGENKEQDDPIKNTRKMVNDAKDTKKSAWKKLIGSMVKLWNKFKENIVQRYNKKVQYLKDNEKYIKMPRLDHEISMSTINHDKIKDIQIPDFNYNTMKEYLNSEEAFMNSQSMLKNFMPTGQGESISQKVISYVIDTNKKITNANQVDPWGIYNGYCKNFLSIVDQLKDMTKVIENGEKKADIIAKSVKESSIIADIDDPLYAYFNEEGEGGFKDEEAKKDGDKDKGSSNVSNQLKVYFTTCGKILAAKMTVCQKVFNEYNAYLTWHIGKKKNSNSESSNDNGENNSGGSESQGFNN